MKPTYGFFYRNGLTSVFLSLFIVTLRQICSAESKKIAEPEEVDREPKPWAEVPWAVVCSFDRFSNDLPEAKRIARIQTC